MIKRESKPQNFEHSAVILLAAALIVKVIGAIFKIPLARTLDNVGFGYFASAYDIYIPVYTLSMAGLPIAVSRLVAENMAAGRYKDAKKTLKIAKKLFCLLGILGVSAMLLAIYPFVKITTDGGASAGYTAACVAAIAPAIFFCSVMSSYRGYYEGLRNMYPTAISEVIEALGKLILGFGIAFVVLKITNSTGFAAAGALLGIMIGTFAAGVFLSLRHKISGDGITREMLETAPKSRSSKTITRMLIAIAIPIALSSLASNITLIIDTVMVKWQLKNVMDSSFDYISQLYANSIKDYNASVKFEEMLTASNMPTFLYGVRAKAYTIYNLIPTLTTTLGIGAIPILTTAWVKKDMRLVKHNIESILRTTAIIAVPAGIGVMAISKYVMGLLYGDVASVEIGGPILTVLGVAAVFSGVSVPITSMLQAIGKPMVPVKNIAIGASLKVIVNLLLVGRPSVNIKGAPVGTMVCYGYIFFANIICLIKYSGVKPNLFSVIGKPLIASFACGTAAYVVSELVGGSFNSNLIIVGASMLVAVVVYLVAIFALRTLTAEDIESFPKGKSISKLLKKLRIIS